MLKEFTSGFLLYSYRGLAEKLKHIQVVYSLILLLLAADYSHPSVLVSHTQN
jgi:hypothetical protein